VGPLKAATISSPVFQRGTVCRGVAPEQARCALFVCRPGRGFFSSRNCAKTVAIHHGGIFFPEGSIAKQVCGSGSGSVEIKTLIVVSSGLRWLCTSWRWAVVAVPILTISRLFPGAPLSLPHPQAARALNDVFLRRLYE